MPTGETRRNCHKVRILASPLLALWVIRAAMAECPICRRSYDSRFQVFVPSHHEGFDTVECARRAAEASGWDPAAPVAVILPTVEVADARSRTQVASATPRRKVAALSALVVAPGQAVLATGVGLLAAGTAASIYLSVQPSGKNAPSSAVAAGAPQTPQTVGPPPSATRPSAGTPGPTASAGRPKPPAAQPSAAGSAPTRPPTKTTHAVRQGSPSAAQAQYATYQPPFSSGTP